MSAHSYDEMTGNSYLGATQDARYRDRFSHQAKHKKDRQFPHNLVWNIAFVMLVGISFFTIIKG